MRDIDCPRCKQKVSMATPPKFGESTDKSLYICWLCGWESKLGYVLDPIVPKPGNGPESEALSR